MIKKIFLINLVLLFFAGFVFGTDEKKLDYPVDIMGEGGAGVASYGKLSMVYMNPASVAASPDFSKIPILQIGASVNPGSFSFISN